MIYQLSHKLRAQMTQFSGKLSQGLSKPMKRFADEMIYGLTASQSLMLSEISRSLNESIPLLKTETRLCRNLGKKELCFHMQRILASSQSSHIKEESLLVLDLSDISKKYAEHMQYLARVRDGSDGVLANGYWTCQVLGVEGHKLIPLYGHLYSSLALLSFAVKIMKSLRLSNLSLRLLITKEPGLSIEEEIAGPFLIPS